EDRPSVEGQDRKLAAQPEEVWQVLVGLLLPAGGPDELERVVESQQPLAAAISDAVRDPVDRVEGAGGRLPVREAEEADHAVDVHEQDRTFVFSLGRIVTSLLHEV